MNETLRQKKVARLIKDTLSSMLVTHIQDSPFGFISITRVVMSRDLRTAHIYLSVFENQDPEGLLGRLKEKKGMLRKAVASRTKLKYNPKLIFSLDPMTWQTQRLDEILDAIENDER